jgi:hypothetical protein
MRTKGHVLICACKDCREGKCNGDKQACSFSICVKCLHDDSTKIGEEKLNRKCEVAQVKIGEGKCKN